MAQRIAELPAGEGERMAKGQQSLELLILLAAFFAFLAVWVTVINSVRQGSAESMEQKYAELALSDLVGAGDEVYILGSGNARELELRLMGNATVSFDAGNASISILNGSRSWGREVRFRTGDAGIELEKGVNRLLVRNEGGSVAFERR